MPGIIKGFSYDIFISYRQKDNKHDGWVTEFVNNLKGELESTFKEEVSVYFDVNPHDGLLETHDVNASVREKLNCLIFIPVISQTYCDSKSFAWQNEFCVFNRLSKEDKFGRDIRLSNGNVSSRILPVKIHDIDEEDQALIENELGGSLRSIDFIYRSAGVNRPLTPMDNPDKNLNKTYYKDQINKLANAVKEIIFAMKKVDQQKDVISENEKKEIRLPEKYRKTKVILASFLLLLLLVAGYIFIPGLFKSSGPTEKSIAVLPFKLLSEEPDKQYLADGVMDAIVMQLSKIKELRVMSRTSVEQYRKTTKTTRQIGKELGVEYLLEGSFQKIGNEARLIVQLIKANEESHIWADSYNRNWNDIFAVQSEVAQTIAAELHAVITPEERQIMERTPTKDLEAYDAFLKGQFYYEMSGDNRSERAIFWFKESIRLDSSFVLPWSYLSMCYWRQSPTAASPEFMAAKRASERALELDPTSATAIVNMGEILDNEYNFKGAEEKINLALKMDPENPYVLRNAGRFFTKLGRTDEGISFCNRALQLDPLNRTAINYSILSLFYAGKYDDALTLMNKSIELGYPRQTYVYYMILLEEGKTDILFNESVSPEEENVYNIALAAANFKLGRKDIAEKMCTRIIGQNNNDIAYWIAFAYAYGDEPEQVYKWLERSFDAREKEFTYAGVNPAFKKYRNSPRVKKLLLEMGFPI